MGETDEVDVDNPSGLGGLNGERVEGNDAGAGSEGWREDASAGGEETKGDEWGCRGREGGDEEGCVRGEHTAERGGGPDGVEGAKEDVEESGAGVKSRERTRV